MDPAKTKHCDLDRRIIYECAENVIGGRSDFSVALNIDPGGAYLITVTLIASVCIKIFEHVINALILTN